MRILVTGCGGMLGDAVYADLMEHKHDVFASDINQSGPFGYLDVRVADDVKRHFKAVEPDLAIHLAALTDMEYCEVNPAHAYDVNFMGTHNVAQAANVHGIPLVYLSTAGIFDGAKVRYKEDDVPNPLNVYAKSKYAGELAAMTHFRPIIIRAGWMMGGGPLLDKKFVNKIIKQVRGGVKQLSVVEDKLGTPTYTYELARSIHEIFSDERNEGIFHSACSGGCSRVDVARAILEVLGLEKKITVTAVRSDHFKREYFATRPRSEKLVSTRLENHVDWRDCLKDYLERFDWKV